MTWADWAVGWPLTAVQLLACGVAGHGVRRRLLPAWSGPAAVVAAGMSASVVLVLTAQALGSVGLFRQWVLPPVLVGVAWILDPGRSPWRVDLGDGEVTGDAAPPAPHAYEARWVGVAGLVAAAVVLASWLERAVAVYRRGTTDGDSMMYHVPFAARFVQSGWTTSTEAIGPDAWVAFYPANAELIDAAFILPFGAAVLGPLANLGWLALALGSAWCIGATAGRAALGLVLGAVVMSVPVMVATQGGTARVDGATVALVLAAVALVLQTPRSVGSCVLAGLALGLAIGTKFAVLPLAGVLLVTVALALWRRHGGRSAVAWIAATAVTSGYWYVRNLLVTGSPVPAVDLRLGPIGFAPLPSERLELLEHSSIVDNVGEPGFWGNIARPAVEGLTGSVALTIALMLAAVAAAVLVAVQRPIGLRHAVTLSALVGCVAYPFGPNSAPLLGGGTQNPFATLIVGLNVRYLLPSLVVLLCMLPVGLGRRSGRVGDVAVAAAAGMVGYLWLETTAFDAEWPTGEGDRAIAAALVALAAAGVVAGRALATRGGGTTAGAVPALLFGATAVVGAMAVTGWVAADRSGLHLYAEMPPDVVALWRASEEAPGDRVALLDGWVQSPHLGPGLDRTVDFLGLSQDRGLSLPPRLRRGGAGPRRRRLRHRGGAAARRGRARVVGRQLRLPDGERPHRAGGAERGRRGVHPLSRGAARTRWFTSGACGAPRTAPPRPPAGG